MQSLTPESEFRRTHKNLETKYKNQNVMYMNCPVEASLGVLGKKWTIVIIRDIGVYGRDRFKLATVYCQRVSFRNRGADMRRYRGNPG